MFGFGQREVAFARYPRGHNMGAQEEILSEFFSKLQEQGLLPEPTILRLKELWRDGKLASKAEIRDAIARGMPNGTETEGD
jgi:hypothetical protein